MTILILVLQNSLDGWQLGKGGNYKSHCIGKYANVSTCSKNPSTSTGVDV